MTEPKFRDEWLRPILMTAEVTALCNELTPAMKRDLGKLVRMQRKRSLRDYPSGMYERLRTGQALARRGLVCHANKFSWNRYTGWLPTELGCAVALELERRATVRTLDDVLADLCSPEFAASLPPTSSSKILADVLADHPRVTELTKILVDSPSWKAARDRIAKLVTEHHQIRMAYPYQEMLMAVAVVAGRSACKEARQYLDELAPLADTNEFAEAGRVGRHIHGLLAAKG